MVAVVRLSFGGDDHPGSPDPIVIGVDDVPWVRDPVAAARLPELAVQLTMEATAASNHQVQFTGTTSNLRSPETKTTESSVLVIIDIAL